MATIVDIVFQIGKIGKVGKFGKAENAFQLYLNTHVKIGIELGIDKSF